MLSRALQGQNPNPLPFLSQEKVCAKHWSLTESLNKATLTGESEARIYIQARANSKLLMAVCLCSANSYWTIMDKEL